MSRGPKITEKQFNAAKMLLQSGIDKNVVYNCLDLSKSVIDKIARSKDLNDYKRITNASYYKKLEAEKAKKEQPAPAPQEKPAVQVVEHRQNVTVQASHYMMTEMQKTNEFLKAISAKLAFIVDELCGTGKGGVSA